MLDEKREYEEYTKYLCDYEKCRLMSKFMKSGKGNVRPLYIIARQLLDEKGYYSSEDEGELKKIRDEVKQKLYEWCSFDKADDKTLPKWIGKKEKQWNTDNIYNVLEQEHNTLYAVNFLMVIRDSIEVGPLKTRYLICRKEFQKALENEKIFRFKTSSENNLDRLLKIITENLLKEKMPNMRLAKVNTASWMAFPGYSEGNHSIEIFYSPLGNSEYEQNIAKDGCKDVIDSFGFKLIDKEELGKYKKAYEKNYGGYIVYEENTNKVFKKEEKETGLITEYTLYDYFKNLRDYKEDVSTKTTPKTVLKEQTEK